MSIKRLSIKGLTKNPNFSAIYKDYNKLSVYDYNNLLTYLYSGSSKGWENPLTTKELNRNSKIIISFLSYCYYNLDDGSKVDIKGHNLSYRGHVLNFIDEIYLYEKGRVSTTVIPALARSPSPARSTARSPSPARGTAQAARGTAAVPVQTKSSSSSAKMSYSPSTIYKTAQSMVAQNDTSHKLSKDLCINFAKEIRRLKKGLTREQIKDLKIKNPITSKEIGFKSPIFQRLLFKCYNNFDDDNLKKTIRKVVSKKFLDDLNTQIGDIQNDQRTAAEKVKEAKRLAEEKRKAAAQAAAQAAIDEEKRIRENNKPICDKYIDDYMKEFHKRCDELESECDRNGILSEYKYITDVINAIVVVIFTKYLHLNYYYDDLYTNYKFDAPLPICLMMYNDEMKDYCDSIGESVVNKMVNIAYDRDKVIYQRNDLKQEVTKALIDNIPRTNESYYLNTLLNQQFVFNMKKDGDRYYVNPNLTYNKYNELKVIEYIPMLSYRTLSFPATLEFVKKQLSYRQFNYNITNSGLPRTIFVTAVDEVLRRHAPFSELIGEINERLARMPIIEGIKTEATHKPVFYEGILQTMEQQSFGSNDIIRRNILYSLNAQTPNYIHYRHNYNNDVFYNYNYSGMFPLFSWIPLETDSQTAINIYKLSSIFRWQPYGYDKNSKFKTLGDAYKNYGVHPYSKGLNEAIYKIITDVHSSVLGMPISTLETDRLIERVKKTVGVYKDMELDPQYIIDNLYFYHGAANRLHTMKDRDNDIQILGFLSTTLNIYTASYYSEVASKGSGYIYIIECDDKKSFINLNDQLYQFLLIPNSIIRILSEFKFGDLTIILCRLIMTPTKEENIDLYNNLLGIQQAAKKSNNSDDAAGAAGSLSGGIYSMKQIQEKLKSNTAKADNIIKPKPDMRKIGDMPEDIREYYGITLTEKNKNQYVDINNGCYVRLISRKKVNKMIANSV
jgi:hypothetical protein